MKDKHDFIPEELDEQKQPLIEALRSVYRASAEDTQSLARMQERLLTERGSRTSLPGFSDTPQHTSVQGARTVVSNCNRKNWRHRLSTIAAVLCTVLVVGMLSVVLTTIHRQKAGVAGQTPLPTIVLHRSHTPLGSLNMIDARSGWAVTASAIVRTTNGGVTWKNVTPPHTTWWRAEAFLTVSVAWVLVENQDDGYDHILRTVNGGQTWQDVRLNYRIPLESSDILNIDALNAQECWLYAVSAILHTADGGRTWQTLLTPQNAHASLYYVGWLSFRDASTGWAFGAGRTDTASQLFVTHDGGQTWRYQTLPLPPQVTLANATIIPPRFFDANNGILPIGFDTRSVTSGRATDFFVTHDGGLTWRMRATSTLVSPETVDFLDMNHWFAAEAEVSRASFETIIYATVDGGQHWTAIHPRSDYRLIFDIKFVSSTVGWALGNNVNPEQKTPGPAPGYLLQTVDEGRSWS